MPLTFFPSTPHTAANICVITTKEKKIYFLDFPPHINKHLLSIETVNDRQVVHHFLATVDRHVQAFLRFLVFPTWNVPRGSPLIISRR